MHVHLKRNSHERELFSKKEISPMLSVSIVGTLAQKQVFAIQDLGTTTWVQASCRNPAN